MSKIQQMVEFAKQLRQVNVASLSEQQRTEYTAMVSKLQEELTGLQKQGVAEGVQDTMSLNDAAKVLRHYGATNLKTTSNELHFYKDGRPLSVDLIFNDDATRSVSLSQLNAATRKLKGQGIDEGYSVTRGIDTERYQERNGLEGPFSAKSGKVVYYDPHEGKYYDPDTDMYIEYDEWQAMNEDWNDMMDYVKSRHSANGSQGIKRGRSYGSGEDTEDEDYFNDKEQQTRGPLVRPTSQNTGHRVWSGKTQPKIPFDESIDTQAYDRLKRVFDFSDYKG